MTAATPAEFILARTAETEHLVKDGAQGVTASYYGWHTVDCGVGLGYWANEACECRYVDRVLAQCAAYRRIVEDRPYGWEEYADSDDALRQWDATLRALATIWADHQDYRPEWKP